MPVTLTMKKTEEASIPWNAALRRWLKREIFWTHCVGSELELLENDPKSMMRVLITGVSDERVVVLPEKVGHVRGLKSEKGVRRKCDYALFVEKKGRVQIVLIELKVTLRSGDAQEDYKEQLRRTRPIVDYLRSIVQLERHGVQIPATFRYVLICEAERRLEKTTVRHQRWRLIEKWKSGGISGASFVGNSLPLQAVLQKAPRCG